MMYLRLENEIVCLNNVKSVNKTVCEHKHTSCGKAYFLFDTIIRIDYFNGESYYLRFEDFPIKVNETADMIFEKIFDILSK